MRKTYWLSLILFGIALFAMISLSTKITAIIDAPSVIVTVVFPLVMIPAVFSWNEVKTAFKSPFSSADVKQLKTAAHFWIFIGKALNTTGFLGFISGIIMILSNISDVSQIGPGMAISLLCVLYVAILQIVLVLPFKIATRKKIDLLG